MPHSYSLGKPEAVDYILKNVSKKAKILDVGPGVGTYTLLGRIGRCLVAVPYLCPQSGVEFEHEGIKLVNPHEEHKQADLTPENMLTRYPALKELWRDEQYGYYVKEK